jgi:DNA polymerase-3 subunit beta
MELTISRELFLNSLQKIQSIIEKKSSLPILSHSLLHAKGNFLEILATDLTLAFKTNCEGEIIHSGKIVVPAKALYEITRNLNCEKIKLRENKNHWLEIIGENSYFCLATLPVEEFPLFPETKHFQLTSINKELLHKALLKTYFSIAKEETDTSLFGLCCEKLEEKLRFVSTDRFRLTYMDIPFSDLDTLKFESKIMIPKKAVLEILRFSPYETLQISFDTNGGIIKINEDLLYLRLMENKFPQYHTIIPESNKYEAKISKSLLRDVLKRMNIFTTDRVKIADFFFSKNKLLVQVDNPQIGKAEETLEIELALAEDIKISFNISFLLDVLTVLDSELFIFGLNTMERMPCVISGENDIGFKSLIMPVIEKEK